MYLDVQVEQLVEVLTWRQPGPHRCTGTTVLHKRFGLEVEQSAQAQTPLPHFHNEASSTLRVDLLENLNSGAMAALVR